MVSRRVLLAALAAFVASAASASGPVAVVSGRFAPAPIDPNCDRAYLVCYYNCAPSNWYDQSCEDKCRPLRDACKPHLASATVGMNGKCLYECTQERAKCTGTPDQCDSQLQVCEGTCGLRAPSPSSNKCADTCQIKYSQCLSTPYCSQDFYCPSECAADYNSCAQACPSSSSSPVASSHPPVGMDPCERVCDAMNWKGLLSPGQYDRCLAECARQAAPTESTRTVRDWPTLKMAVATPVREGPTPSCVASCRDAQGTCNNAMPGNEYSCAAQYQQCLSQCPWNNVEVEVEEVSKPQPHKPTVSECIASCPTKALEKCAKEPIARRAMCRARVPLTLIKCQAACAHPNGFEIEAPKPKPSSPLLGDCQPCDAIYDQCLPACNGMSNCQLKCMQNHFDCRMATPGC